MLGPASCEVIPLSEMPVMALSKPGNPNVACGMDLSMLNTVMILLRLIPVLDDQSRLREV